ncbi:major facilitator superfamily domain-containing protein [Dunaliella salina]|uniref:Major facilitator superfamily domain-containing protein n=1 Tax=Dunaliella salina TaxID=3046 RepID=A0ABQ7H1R5_DUNSA|nr:major facilitator superfamily domain-containing protein [Dunaliella salina]|eukprot:KAF5840808.1 major facilitator superfamily domain-containing protein [Dunaliella salina]
MSTAILPMAEEFSWEKAYQGIVLSSFFTGYALTQVLGGQLADKYGGKRVLAAGVSLWSLFTALTPEAAALGTAPLLAARVLLGVGEGIAFPAIHSMIARNVPVASQSTAVGVVTAASYAGTALAFGVSPYIISEFGWPVGVSLGGSSGTQFYSAASSNDPSSSGANELGSASTGGLRALFSRRELWAICVAQYCQSWGMYGLLNWLPTFFKDYYKVEIADLAAYTLLPYIVQGGLGAASGVLADRLIASGWSIRSVRILLQTVGMIGPAGCLLLAVSPLIGPSPAIASQIITVGLGFSALSLGGVSVNHLDVAPRHAGLVFGAGNTAATLAGVVSVPFTGYLLQTTESWPLVFGVTAAHYVLGAALWAAWCGDTAVPEDKL